MIGQMLKTKTPMCIKHPRKQGSERGSSQRCNVRKSYLTFLQDDASGEPVYDWPNVHTQNLEMNVIKTTVLYVLPKKKRNQGNYHRLIKSIENSKLVP